MQKSSKRFMADPEYLSSERIYDRESKVLLEHVPGSVPPVSLDRIQCAADYIGESSHGFALSYLSGVGGVDNTPLSGFVW